MIPDNKKCFHHESNKQLQKRGFTTGACVINWEIPCGGTPDSVPYPYQCKGFYVPICNLSKECDNK